MQLLAAAANKACISGILHQRMLELVQRIGGYAALKDQLGVDKPHERVPQLFFGQRGHVGNQAVGELPPYGCSNLRHVLHGRQSIEARRERRMQRRRDGKRRQWPGELIAVSHLLQQSAFEHRLGQLFDEQRNAVGAGDNLAEHFGRKRLASGHARNNGCALVPIETTQCNR